MANPLEIVKAHPIATGVVVIVVIGAVLLLSGSGGDTTYTETGAAAAGDELSASIAMQQLNAQLNARAMEINASKEVALNENATTLTLAQLAKDVALTQGALDYQLEEKRLASTERVTTQTNTLTAALQQRQLENEAAEQAAQFATIQGQTAALLAMNQSNNAAQIAIQKEARKPRGLFSAIFG